MKSLYRTALPILLSALLGACALFKPPEPGIGKPVAWQKVPGWTEDDQSAAWPALLNSCRRLESKPLWQAPCAAAAAMPAPDTESARRFFETWFVPHRVHGARRNARGLITGYYEPLLHGSLTPTDRYRYPLYGRPDGLLIIDLGDRFPQLQRERLRGRLAGNRVIPYYTRADIEADRALLAGHELLWLDDSNDLFFLHIQGSGRVRLPDGRVVGVGYADQNGHPYRAIGKVLVDRGELDLEEVTLFSIRRWLRSHPAEAAQLLNENPSYVFFVLRDAPEEGPVGSLNVPLTPGRSLAIDPALVDLGVPVWLDSHYPGEPERSLQRLVLAQDTGGAIRGNLRADLFWGHGDEAETLAGNMKSAGSLLVLLPRAPAAQE